MNDDLTPDDLNDDPELAAVLAVAPLDDLTRRLLVRTALARRFRATRPVGRLAAASGIAAALVIGVLIGTLVVTRPDDPGPTTAARAPTSSPAPSSPAPSAAPDAGAPALVPTSVTPLGYLGVLDSGEALRPAIAARLEAGGDASTTSESADVCVARGPDAAGLAVISAVGTATLDTGPAVILVGPTPIGENLAVVLDPTSCAVLETVTLQD
jgi:hypothetical protein